MISPNDFLEDLFRLKPAQKSALKKLGLISVNDLLYHFPGRHEERPRAAAIRDCVPGQNATVVGSITNIKTAKTFRRKTPVAQATLSDGTGTLSLIWFSQPYLAKMLKEGSLVRVSGKVTKGNRGLSIANPSAEHLSIEQSVPSGPLFSEGTGTPLSPFYPESRGITSLWFEHAIKKVLQSGVVALLKDPLPKELLERYHLPSLASALMWIHAPRKAGDVIAARKRFAFEEIFLIQLGKQQEREQYRSLPSFRINKTATSLKDFLDHFPFKLTGAQQRAIDTTLHDVGENRPMSRLLEGDVGSGKTAVAAALSYAVVSTRPSNGGVQEQQDFGNLQVAYMTPTEILAKQQFESFIKNFSHLPIQIGLLTSSGCRKFPSKVDPRASTAISRAQLLKWIENGEIPILVGTHALIQKSVRFKNLACVIIDEQHRFGTLQRQALVRKDGRAPHLLSMTATPIPRTLALTVYGDLDLTLLDEMPAGRKPIETAIVMPQERASIYEKVRREINAGRQAYIICPRIDEPDPEKELALYATSAKKEAERLKAEIFPEYTIGLLHSKMRPAEKDEVMERFAQGRIHILVATSVVEVGVSVPNATIILIEGAERFGLAQLHQLRGRVLRSEHQAYCFVLTESSGAKAGARLSALKNAKNGFELAELDLKLRGAGGLYGRKQWGVSDIGMEAIQNIKMVEAAREGAKNMIEDDPTLDRHALLKNLAERKKKELHFE